MAKTKAEREELRRRIAADLRTLLDTQASKVSAWLTIVNEHAVASGSILADAIESGKIDYGEVLADTAAMTYECVSKGFELLIGTTASKVTINGVDMINKDVDEYAELAGPFQLTGVTVADFPNVFTAPLVGPVGVAPLPVEKSILGNSVYVTVGNLRPEDNPLPLGSYQGNVNLNVPGQNAKLLAMITLVRV